MKEDYIYNPDDFLKYFPNCIIQYFTDDKSQPLENRHVTVRTFFDEEEAIEMQTLGYGVFFSINGFKDGERKVENLQNLNGVYVDLDVAKEGEKLSLEELQLKKTGALEKIEYSPLRPHFVTDTKNGFHLIWLVEDLENGQEFNDISKKLAKYFDGDEGGMAVNKLLRVPGFRHMKDPNVRYECKLLKDNSEMSKYKKAEIISSFISMPVTTMPENTISSKRLESYSGPSPEIQVALKVPIKDAIAFSAGQAGINAEFKENADGSTQIIENGEITSAFISSRGEFVFSSSGKDRRGNSITVAEYYLNKVGNNNYNRQQIAEMLIGKFSEKKLPGEVGTGDNPLQLPISTFSEILKKGFSKVEYIVRELIVKREVNMLVGDPGSGKSLVYEYMSCCIVKGLPVFGTYETVSTNVLIINVDDSLSVTMGRIKGMGYQEDPSDCKIHFWTERLFKIAEKDKDKVKITESLIDRLSSEVKEKKIGLVVFDTLRQIHDGDENVSLDMNKVMTTLKQFAENNDCGVILVHHQRKNDGRFPSSNIQSPSGSIAIMANVFSSLHLTQTKDKSIKIERGKNKMNGESKPIYIAVHKDEAMEKFFQLTEAPQKPEMEAVIGKIMEFYNETPDPQLTKEEFAEKFAEKIKVSKSLVKKAFNESVERGYLQEDGIKRQRNKHFYIKTPEIPVKKPNGQGDASSDTKSEQTE